MFANWIVYWSGWGVYSTLMVVLLLGYLLMAISFRFRLNVATPKLDWQAAPWNFAYLIGMGIVSYIGQFPGSGGVRFSTRRSRCSRTS